MKILVALSVALLAAALLGIATLARADGLTREQVKAELAEAIRTGEHLVGDNSNHRLRDINPGKYPARPKEIGKTREQVKAELAEALRVGDVPISEQGLTAYELAPHRFPVRAQPTGKTRAEVRAELAEAIRLGDAPITGDRGLTPAQINPQRFAAARAANSLAMQTRESERSTMVESQGASVR